MIGARLSSADKLTLAKEIFHKAQALLDGFGKPETMGGNIQVVSAQIADFKIVMLTPFPGVKSGHGDFGYQVEMWHDKIGKVYGASWSPYKRWANKFECFRMVKGEWINRFLVGGES